MNTQLVTPMNRSVILNPMREIQRMQQRMERLFGQMWNDANLDSGQGSALASGFVPSCDVVEAETHYLFSLDVPGVKKEDIKVEIKNNVLTVSGERKEEIETKKRSRYQSEQYYGAFERSFTLPTDIDADKIETDYTDGVLRLAFPKTHVAQGRVIRIGDQKTGLIKSVLAQDKTESKH